MALAMGGNDVSSLCIDVKRFYLIPPEPSKGSHMKSEVTG
jgi:hypothetical protein